MSSKKIFVKIPLTIQQQIELLQKRNLHIEDQQYAKSRLSSVSYYRLSAYFKPFEQLKLTHQFQENVNFQHIWRAYEFDRKLRLLVWDAIEKIEVALRTSLNNHLSLNYGAFWYLNDNLFLSDWTKYQGNRSSPRDFIIKEIEKLCTSRKDEAILHYFQNYQSPNYPPSWMIMESLSFGAIANFYMFLASKSDKKAIAKIFDLHPQMLSQMLQPIRYIRNICAHHSRVWNRWYLYKMPYLKEWPLEEIKPNSFYQQAWLIATLLAPIFPDSSWLKGLFELMSEYSEMPFEIVGFPAYWQQASLWKCARLKL